MNPPTGEREHNVLNQLLTPHDVGGARWPRVRHAAAERVRSQLNHMKVIYELGDSACRMVDLYALHCEFTMLVQFMGEEAIDRLLLLDGPQFTADPDLMLDLLARVTTDR